MNSVNYIFYGNSDFGAFVKAEKLSADKEYLIRIHTCIHDYSNIMPFVNMILSYLPAAKIIGSSTSGVICGGGIKTDCCMISVTEFETASIKTAMIGLSDLYKGDLRGSVLADMAADIVISDKSRYMLAFFARPFIKIGSFVERLNEKKSNMHIIGGVANTPRNPMISMARDAFVFDNNSVSNDSVAIAVIDSSVMTVNSDLIYVTEPVGSCHTITDADGMIIRSIDGENAVEWYQRQLGIDLEKENSADTTVLFPLVRSDHGDLPWAVVYSSQKGSDRAFADEPDPLMYVPSEAKAGERVRISYSSIQKTVELCEEVCKKISRDPAEVLFGYSCVSRQDLFSNCSKWELTPFANTNLSGALVAGEIGNLKNVNRYCNYSFAVSALAESGRRIRINTDILHENSSELVNRQEHIVKYLINYSKSTDENNGLSIRRQEIKDTLFIDDETGLGNLTKYSYDFSLGKFDKICMLTLRNEGLLNAFVSKSKFQSCLNRFHKAVIDHIGNEDFDYYIYKKSTLIITGSSKVSDSEFIDRIKNIQEFMTDFKFAGYVPVNEFSIVMHEDDMIKKAELTLVSMRSKNIFFLNYTSDLGLEQIHARKLKMLKILNDAIANGRVVPYLQGIRNNNVGRITIYESLMRIEDSDGTVYTPCHFMDIAKEYGFYSDISYMMISQVMELFRDREESVAINLNICDVYNYKIVHYILKFLESAPNPDQYIFELTETEEIEDYQIIAEFVDRIHQMGGKIAIDDFGSGFSNIVNIFKIKSDYIKIDGEIVKNIKNDIFALEFLEMIAGWAKKHGKEIIAEFIENSEIQSLIEKNNIGFSQGYLFSKPSDALQVFG